MINFKQFDDNAKALLAEFQSKDMMGSEYSYYAFLVWFKQLEYAVSDTGDALFLRAFVEKELRYWMPLVRGNMTVEEAIDLLPENSRFTFVHDSDFEHFSGDKNTIFCKRNWSEYIYKTSDFVNLVGKRYSAKRNHISKFLKNYEPVWHKYGESPDDYVRFHEFEQKWQNAHNFSGNFVSTASEEHRIVDIMLDGVLSGELVGEYLTVDGNFVGISIAEILASNTAVVMYEKADIAYDGIYSFLANGFAKRNLSSTEFLNRQEDMGLQGLRKSKLSYYPEFLLSKCMVVPNSCLNDMGLGLPLCKANIADTSAGDADNGVGENNANGNDCALNSDVDNAKLAIEKVSEKACENVCGCNSTDQDKGCSCDSDSALVCKDVCTQYSSFDLGSIEIERLYESDFNDLMTFLKCGIESLDNKLHFLNYTDQELMSILGSGIMKCARVNGHIVASGGIDFDKDFGDKIKEIVGDERDRQYYEISGIMVCRHMRGRGLASMLCNDLIDEAKQRLTGSTLIATIQYDNLASIANFKKLGFEYAGKAKYRQFDFVYYTLDIN